MLYHINERKNEKLIGFLSSKEKAKSIIKELVEKPGFKDCPNGFRIKTMIIGKDYYTKGFKSIVISNRGNEILDNSEETNNFGQKGVNVYYTKKQSRKSGKELGNDYPGQSDYEPPEDDEDQEAYLKRILDKKYGKENWKKGPKSDYNQIKKAIERGGHKAWNAKK